MYSKIFLGMLIPTMVMAEAATIGEKIAMSLGFLIVMGFVAVVVIGVAVAIIRVLWGFLVPMLFIFGAGFVMRIAGGSTVGADIFVDYKNGQFSQNTTNKLGKMYYTHTWGDPILKQDPTGTMTFAIHRANADSIKNINIAYTAPTTSNGRVYLDDTKGLSIRFIRIKDTVYKTYPLYARRNDQCHIDQQYYKKLWSRLMLDDSLVSVDFRICRTDGTLVFKHFDVVPDSELKAKKK